MIALLMATMPVPDGVPLCGTGGEASRALSSIDLDRPPEPPARGRLPYEWSIERHDDIIVMRDMVGDGFGRNGLEYNGMEDAFYYFYSIFGDQFDFVTFLTEQDSSNSMGAFAFYAPVANDISGIGQSRYNQNQTLQGLLFMNSYQYWGSQLLASAVFGQELGHKWGAYLEYDLGEGDRDDMLGRDDAHWSYWLETSNSPMEGNAWYDNGDGTFSLDSDEEVAYSDLDLYVMGLIPPSEVDPWFLIGDPSLNRSASSTPEYYYGSDQTTEGTRIDITIDDVIAAEGERDPAAGDSPTNFTMAVVILLANDEQQRRSIASGVESVRENFVEVWEEDVQYLATLDTTLGDVVIDPLDPEVFASPTVVPTAAW
jgi:hypothetical protein